mmetsp:Transcript_24898/g.57448  ORF Transcript_24898/g.57448 Transcript_24898/m.57448 type:complete len:234 (+) Transcript_24898:499-1200(+)
MADFFACNSQFVLCPLIVDPISQLRIRRISNWDLAVFMCHSIFHKFLIPILPWFMISCRISPFKPNGFQLRNALVVHGRHFSFLPLFVLSTLICYPSPQLGVVNKSCRDLAVSIFLAVSHKLTEAFLPSRSILPLEAYILQHFDAVVAHSAWFVHLAAFVLRALMCHPRTQFGVIRVFSGNVHVTKAVTVGEQLRIACFPWNKFENIPTPVEPNIIHAFNLVVGHDRRFALQF